MGRMRVGVLILNVWGFDKLSQRGRATGFDKLSQRGRVTGSDKLSQRYPELVEGQPTLHRRCCIGMDGTVGCVSA